MIKGLSLKLKYLAVVPLAQVDCFKRLFKNNHRKLQIHLAEQEPRVSQHPDCLELLQYHQHPHKVRVYLDSHKSSHQLSVIHLVKH